MICPFCGNNEDRVIDSRSSEGGRAIRRRRVCDHCDKRFTTYERVERIIHLMVVKSDERREPFDATKILKGIEAACGKLKISADTKQRVVEETEEELRREFEREVPARLIGQRVAAKLFAIDKVAYIRFESVYKQVSDLDELADEIHDAQERHQNEVPGQAELF
ncbi:MAG: transcriptional repressor NrdR [Planctomycetes bacterium]|nr:transcriptional repressor NrdR [Planctomycetota bacterium]NOG53872.1 transcriptional repressor NrdR [Planctomycetota bacterium]